MKTERQQQLIVMVMCGVAISIGFVLYAPFSLYFLNDDFIHIPLSGRGALFQRNSFRPVCDWSVQLDYIIWNKTAWGYHLTNLVLHVINSILVFVFSKQLCRTFKMENAFVHALPIATLFFIYAFHSEAVYWIIGRSAALGVMFFLPACIFYLKRNEGRVNFYLSLLCYVVGLLTYESTWVFPAFAILVSFSDFKLANRPKEWGRIGILLLAFVLYILARYFTIGEIFGAYESSTLLSFKLVKLGAAFIKLLARTFVAPYEQSLFFITSVFLGFLILLLLGFAIRKRIKRDLLIALALPMLLVSIVPYLSLGIDTHSVEGERFLYMPSLFASILITRFAFLASRSSLIFVLLLFALFGYHLYFLARAGQYYRTASLITETTFKNMNALHQKKVLIIDSLPQSFNGALIFRSGFAEGVQWLRKPGTVDNVLVHSIRRNNNSWKKTFTAGSIATVDPPTINYFLQKIEHKEGYEKIPMPLKKFSDYKDVYFLFTDSALMVVK